MSSKVILVGGFLGAGKTTLLWEASKRFTDKKGLNVGLITNDQAPDLVDSTLLSSKGLVVSEVSGSCFCCNFNGFINAVKDFGIDKKMDIIIAEPVGSCTDLSATIMQPLKQYWSQKIGIAPLSVMTDPVRLESILNGGNAGLHTDAAYILKKQLQESDIIVINKCDLLSTEKIESLKRRTSEKFPLSSVMVISALTGEGVDAWIDEVINRNDAGKHIVEIDYDKYANGEAVMGWLNGTVIFKGKSFDCNGILHRLMKRLSQRFEQENISVGHVKTIIESGENNIISNFTGGSETLSFRGNIDSVVNYCQMTINARTETSPEYLDKIICSTLKDVIDKTISTEIVTWKYLKPGRPDPTYRYDSVFY